MAETSSDFVVRIKADASDAVGKIEQVDKALDDTAAKAEGLSDSLDKSEGLGAELASQASQMAEGLSHAFDYAASMEKAFASASAAVEPLGASLASEFEGVSGQFNNFSNELTDVQQRLISSQVALDGMGEKIRNTLEGLGADAPRKTVNELISLSNTVDKLNAAYERQSDHIIDIKLQLKEATSQLSSLESAQSGIVEQARKELTMLESRLEEFQHEARENIEAGFKPSPGVERSIQTLEQRIAMLQEGISGDHMALPGYAEYAAQTNALSSFIGQLQERLTAEEESLAKVDKQAGMYGTRINALATAQEKAAAAAQTSESRFQKIGKALSSVGSAMASAAKMAGSFAKSVAGVGLQGLRNMASVAGKIGNAISAWNKHTLSAGDAVKALHKKFTSFFSMMLTRLKRMAITAIFKDVSSTSGQIAQVSDSYNTAISGMVNSSKAFGAQIVAIAEPIVSILGPAISRLLDLLTDGADRLAQFTARLAGQDTYIKASKGIYDYASAMDDSTSSAKKAERAAKSFKASVMSFDELHRLEGADNNSDDASEITGLTDGQIAKAKVQATAFNEVADRIRNAWGRGDYGAVGLIAAQQVGRAFDWLKSVAGWSQNANKFKDMLAGIAAAVNGFVTGLNGSKIGGAIADVANTVLNSFDILLHDINATAIGQKIGSIISSFARDVDWTLAGQNLVAGFEFIIDMAAGFLNTDALAQLGAGVASFFAGIASEFDPAHVGDVLAEAVNGIASFLATAFNPETFAEAGAKFGEMVNVMFAGISPSDVADGINNFVNSIAGFINSALDTMDWNNIGETLSQIGSRLDWGSIFEVIAIAALPALIPAVVGLIGKALGAALIASGAGIPVLIAGLVAAVVAALALNWDKIKEWAANAWAKIKEWGSKIGDFFAGIVGGIVDGLKSVGDFFASVGEGIANGARGVGSWLGDRAKDVKNFFAPDWDGMSPATAPDTIVTSGATALTETALACADTETVINRINTNFQTTIRQATTLILNALNSSGDVVLYVDSERLARATVRGLNTADLRQNATGNIAFV